MSVPHEDRLNADERDRLRQIEASLQTLRNQRDGLMGEKNRLRSRALSRHHAAQASTGQRL